MLVEALELNMGTHQADESGHGQFRAHPDCIKRSVPETSADRELCAKVHGQTVP